MNKRNRQMKKTFDKPAVQTRRVLDAFQNIMARIGNNTPSLLEGTNYELTRLTKNYQLMNTLYRSHWIVRKVIDTIPEDMTKNWYTINSTISPDLLDRMAKMERKTRVKAKVLDALKWGRLYGGAAALMLIDGHENIMSESLDYDTIMPSSFKGLMVLDRWSGITPGVELVKDINDPEFGLPDKYRITTADGTTFDVDHSRVLRFIGCDVPYWEKVAEQYWSVSEIEVIYDELKKRDNTSWNIANLVFQANLHIMKMSDLGEALAIGDDQANTDLYNTIQTQKWLQSSFGMMILDNKDGYETHDYTFSGLNDIYESFMMDLSGASGIPITKLFGRSPAGLNATGEGDLQNYYNLVEQKQESQLGPVIDKLLPVMAVSEWGQIPDDLDYTWNPVNKPKDKELADLAKVTTDNVVNVFNTGLISQKVALKELRQQSDITGQFSNITDGDIDNADDSTSQGEMLPDLTKLGLDPAPELSEDDLNG